MVNGAFGDSRLRGDIVDTGLLEAALSEKFSGGVKNRPGGCRSSLSLACHFLKDLTNQLSVGNSPHIPTASL